MINYVIIGLALAGLYLFHKTMIAITTSRARKWADEKDKDRDYWHWMFRDKGVIPNKEIRGWYDTKGN